MRTRLDLRHLEMLTAIAEAGSVADAAQVLGVTASALSHRIREAERRLDVQLFTRVGRGLRLTPAADLLRQAAVRLLAELEQVEQAARNMGRGIRHVVRIGIGTYTSYHWLPAFLGRFRGSAPDVQVEIVANAVTAPLKALQERDIDVAIVPEGPLPAGLRPLPLFEDALVAVLPPNHRLASRPFIAPQDLQDEDVLTYSLTTVPGHEVDQFWRPSGVAPRRIVRVEQVDAIVELVKAGFGVSILTRWAMAPHLAAGTLACRPLGPEGIALEWRAVLRDGDDVDTPPGALADALAAWCRDPDGGFGGVSSPA
jgi:LysR family transcriptional regulator for metE and metH